MKRLLRAAIPVAVFAFLTGGGSDARAECPGCGVGSSVLPYFTEPIDGWGGGRIKGGWSQGWRFIGNIDGRALIFPPPNRANVYPDGGFTFYDGEMCSCFQAHSNYAPVNWLLSADESAQTVLDRLKALNIPLVSPEPRFLNKNPRIADNIKLPVPPPKIEKKDKDKRD
jgi:hypothetical protein